MAGFAAAIGGAGNAAMEYGRQARELLEQRRGLFVNIANQRADEEPDPEMSGQWRQAATDAAAGKDFGKFLPKLVKAHDAHQQSTQALGQIAQQIGGNQQPPPPPPPGPAGPGETPGMLPGLQGIPGNQDISMAQPQGGIAAQIAGPPAAPPSPPAAQPATNPLTSVAGTIQAPGTPPPAPTAALAPGLRGGGTADAPLLPMPQPSAPPAIAGGGIPGLPTPENPADIYRDIMARTAPGGTVPLWNAPANRPALQAELNQRLTHQEALRQVLESQQATLAYKRAAAERVLKENPNLPDLVKADILAQAGGLQGFQMGSMMTPRALSQGTLGSEAPPGTVEYGTNEPVKPGTRYKVMYQPATQETIWQPIQPLTRITQTPSGGEQITDLLGGGAIAPVAGAVAPGFNRLLDTGVDSDLHKVYRTPYQILNPGELPITMGTPPSLLEKSSTTSQPGQLPTTRTTRPIPPPGGAQGGAKTPSAANGGGAPAVNPPAVDPLVKRKYDDWSQGGPVPTGKDLSAVQQYAESNHLPTPTQLSATGQKDVRSIDTVIDQIKQIQQTMQDHKMQDDDSRKYYSDYFGYRHEGKNTPLQDLWTKMNFEGIRSAAAALSGVNSRSYQIISRAFEHVPDPSASLTHLPDSPALMYGKLKSMLDMLTAGRQNIVDDEKKSGTIPSGGSITPLSAGSVPGIPGAQTYKQTASGPGGHKIGSNDGKSWFDVATGQAVQ